MQPTHEPGDELQQHHLGSGSVKNHSGSRATQCPDPDEEPTHEPGDETGIQRYQIFMLKISEKIHEGSETGSRSVQNHSGSRATQCPDPDETYP
jgi:hypothetical protein